MAMNYSDPGVVSYRARPGRYITMSAEKVSQNLQYNMNSEQYNRTVSKVSGYANLGNER